uniref:Uncharacterized protein n=1 Tax=Myotis myotis TaxID=51298 RepID=A0A7J7TTM6_MYOMY|nr:hypothetical protein mMyoMyo1_008924 [Myotis myotis]
MHHFLQTSPRFRQLCQPSPGHRVGPQGLWTRRRVLEAAPDKWGLCQGAGTQPMTWDSALAAPAPPRTFPAARACVHGCCRAAHGRKRRDLRVLAAAPLGQPMAGRGGLPGCHTLFQHLRLSFIHVCLGN